MLRTALLIPLALLAACGPKPDNSGPSPEDDRELNEAAAALDANDSPPAAQPAGASAVNSADQSPDQGNVQ